MDLVHLFTERAIVAEPLAFLKIETRKLKDIVL